VAPLSDQRLVYGTLWLSGSVFKFLLYGVKALLACLGNYLQTVCSTKEYSARNYEYEYEYIIKIDQKYLQNNSSSI